MADGTASRTPGLRERKKLRTRSTLIDVATELSLRQGYDNTTVDQIAAAAEVSPRTFSRYFPTKDAVIAAIIEDVTEMVAKELAAQPADITEFEALFRAHLGVIRPTGERSAEPSPTFSRLAVLLQIVNSSAHLTVTNFSFRRDSQRLPGVGEIARRMGLPVEHDAVHLVIDTWQVIMNTACLGLGLPGHEPLDPDTMCDRITATYETFCRLQSPWDPGATAEGQPPAGAPKS
ncbi:TetR/AcrR family transcriptional regulator [Mycolicibacterium mengxianglii]|uniref:TetR/AcrR family transcriptional regulator n=1 Tax=Mycolicibacterium mengxianglii TaxID=2736649 RepID=UPI0018D03C61|nr:TetR family transcriptional regulator [Mycolicibacterium mengxianglii]